ncbi:phage holin family protein [Arthrobacter sp. H14]|uniref:phage holin family protein n=1 Tax=Arthrobacter sp. H14 TaxID=1312959 RepID=UPI00047C78CC|nr:phage holin family protein [Arthrobacter sp. H14]
MSHADHPAEPSKTSEPAVSELVTQLSEQTTRLVRDEMRLAQAELKEKGKHAGVGAGLFGGAGLIAFFGGATLITTIILALALLIPAWFSALIVTVALFIIAGIAALIGKKQVKKAVPPAPERTMDNVKADVNEVKEHGHR